MPKWQQLEWQQVWDDSLIARAAGRLGCWVDTSVLAKCLRESEGLFTGWWQGSLAGRILAQDLAGRKWLAGSRSAAALGLFIRLCEEAALRCGAFIRRVFPSSQVGRVAFRFRTGAEQGGAMFLAGGALGLAAGVIILGLVSGGLTPRRLAAAGALLPAAAFLLLAPGRPGEWLEESLTVRLVRWLLNLGD